MFEQRRLFRGAEVLGVPRSKLLRRYGKRRRILFDWLYSLCVGIWRLKGRMWSALLELSRFVANRFVEPLFLHHVGEFLHGELGNHWRSYWFEAFLLIVWAVCRNYWLRNSCFSLFLFIGLSRVSGFHFGELWSGQVALRLLDQLSLSR